MYHENRARHGKVQSLPQHLDALHSRDVVPLRERVVPVCGTELHQSIQDALRSAARATTVENALWVPDRAARQSLEVVCELARREKLPIEKLLILLKRTWRSLPVIQRAVQVDADGALACVVTHCIEAFYRPSRPH